jgi:hypothetical protein
MAPKTTPTSDAKDSMQAKKTIQKPKADNYAAIIKAFDAQIAQIGDMKKRFIEFVETQQKGSAPATSTIKAAPIAPASTPAFDDDNEEAMLEFATKALKKIEYYVDVIMGRASKSDSKSGHFHSMIATAKIFKETNSTSPSEYLKRISQGNVAEYNAKTQTLEMSAKNDDEMQCFLKLLACATIYLSDKYMLGPAILSVPGAPDGIKFVDLKAVPANHGKNASRFSRILAFVHYVNTAKAGVTAEECIHGMARLAADRFIPKNTPQDSEEYIQSVACDNLMRALAGVFVVIAAHDVSLRYPDLTVNPVRAEPRKKDADSNAEPKKKEDEATADASQPEEDSVPALVPATDATGEDVIMQE